MDSERAAEELSYIAFKLEEEYVDGDALRAAVKAIKAAQDAVERIPMREVSYRLEDERARDDLNQRARDAVIALRTSGYWT